MGGRLQDGVRCVQNFLKDKENIHCIHAVVSVAFIPFYYIARTWRYSWDNSTDMFLPHPFIPYCIFSVLLLIVCVTTTETAIVLSPDREGNMELVFLLLFWLLFTTLSVSILILPNYSVYHWGGDLEGWDRPISEKDLLFAFRGVFFVLEKLRLTQWIFPAICVAESVHLIAAVAKIEMRGK